MMKNLLFILVVFCSFNLIGQTNDTVIVYWKNGNLKYLEYSGWYEDTDSDSISHPIEMSQMFYFDTYGNELSKEQFNATYGTHFLDSITAYGMWKRNTNTKDLSGKRFEYDNLIDKADVSLHFKEYRKSLNYFKQALKIMPNETYPKQRVKELQDYVDYLDSLEK